MKKPSWRDYATIVMAFAAVFLCGYGVGHLVGERRGPHSTLGARDEPPVWEREVLQSLQDALALRPEQTPRVEQELGRTAAAINESYRETVLEYHEHIDALYARLIEILDEEQARRLRREKEALEKKIEMLSAKGKN